MVELGTGGRARGTFYGSTALSTMKQLIRTLDRDCSGKVLAHVGMYLVLRKYTACLESIEYY